MTNETSFPARRSLKRLGIGLGALALGIGLPALPAAAGPVDADETALLWLMNAERQDRGLGPLRLEGTLDTGAASHATAMADQNRLYHTTMTATAPTGWTRLGENVGVGSSAAELHEALMRSPSHRGAMLDPGFDYVGIGVAHGSGATHWVSMKLADHPSGDLGVDVASTDPARTVSTSGLVTTTGGATFHGDLRGVRLAAPIVGMTAMPDGSGYWLAGADGGVFAFGSAPFLGSQAGQRLSSPVSRINRTSTGAGYALFGTDGTRYGFGDAR